MTAQGSAAASATAAAAAAKAVTQASADASAAASAVSAAEASVVAFFAQNATVVSASTSLAAEHLARSTARTGLAPKAA